MSTLDKEFFDLTTGDSVDVTIKTGTREFIGRAKIVEDPNGPVVVIVLPFFRKESAETVLKMLQSFALPPDDDDVNPIDHGGEGS